MNQPPSPDLANDESDEDSDNEASKRRARERLGSFVAQKWHLEALLGVGGMASVYEARHRNGKRVAIKILHPELALSGDTLRRFLREGYLANAVEHPDVVSVLDDGMTDDGLPYLVMEYLEGESLDGRLERLNRPLQLPDVLAIGCTLLDVLHAAHQRGIVHRDLKPDNVFLTLDGGVKVFDFGIARLQDARPNNRHATRTGIAMGTPTFMSREQAHGDLKLIDGRTDIWALGATLYYALTADFPYEARSVAEYMAKLMTADPRPLRSLEPDIPEPIADVIDRALRHDLGRRWQNALDMRLRLIEAAASVGVTIPAQPDGEGFMMPTAPRIRLASFPDERPSVVQKQRNLSNLPTSAGGFDAPARASLDSPQAAANTPIPNPGLATPLVPPPGELRQASDPRLGSLPDGRQVSGPDLTGRVSPEPIQHLPPPVSDPDLGVVPLPVNRRNPVSIAAAVVLAVAVALILWKVRTPTDEGALPAGTAAPSAPVASAAPPPVIPPTPTVEATSTVAAVVSVAPPTTATPPSTKPGPEPASGSAGRGGRPPGKTNPHSPGGDLGATRN